MPIQPRPDWRKIAEAHEVELSEGQIKRLEALSRSLLGLRGLIDWTEEPVQPFQAPLPQQPKESSEEAGS